MTKAEIIKKYGADYYERLKKKCREDAKRYYAENPERERQRKRNEYKENKERRFAYAATKRLTYRISARDRNRLRLMGVSVDGKEVHHDKYHFRNDDRDWIKDIRIMTPSEHRQWHMSHPEFKAESNVIY